MPTVSESATIMADIEDVFALISRVEEFPRYARNLVEVRKIGPRTYRWVARLGGVTLTWDSIISEFRRPTRLSWRSMRGFENTGTYTLARSPAGTRVDLVIDYRMTGALVGDGIARLLTPVTRAAARSILTRVKERLEGEQPGHRAAPLAKSARS